MFLVLAYIPRAQVLFSHAFSSYNDEIYSDGVCVHSRERALLERGHVLSCKYIVNLTTLLKHSIFYNQIF